MIDEKLKAFRKALETRLAHCPPAVLRDVLVLLDEYEATLPRVGRTFSLDESQWNKAKEWIQQFNGEYTGAIGGGITYSFSPTSLGEVAKVIHHKGEELDLTDYDSW